MKRDYDSIVADRAAHAAPDVLAQGEVFERTVDTARLGRWLGALEARPAAALLDVLREFFAP